MYTDTLRSCSRREIENALNHHFLTVNNEQIERLSLPALEPLAKRARMEHINESKDSQVGFLICIICMKYYSMFVF